MPYADDLLRVQAGSIDLHSNCTSPKRMFKQQILQKMSPMQIGSTPTRLQSARIEKIMSPSKTTSIC
jgi:hypothetical protein